ncbi:hypothetical protein [Romboutsia sp. CE17]|uniref:hypothetical protein n=1 Tax=Romboutsia sp. CE17 TaxID=2724150 RepID=UPI001FAC0D29|nr:hypothetical protein [Romboutsia sp. CE17]
MQDLKKNKRKMMNKHANATSNISEVEEYSGGLSRAYRPKGNNDCGQHKHDCNSCEPQCCPPCDPCEPQCCPHPCKPCEPCESCEPCSEERPNETCVENPCADNSCCNAVSPARFSPANSVPVAIEANRIFDTLAFQTFTDATAPNGAPLSFDIDVVDVDGNVPTTGQVNVTIDKVCLSYSSIDVHSPTPKLEDFNVIPKNCTKSNSHHDDSNTCDTVDEFIVCGSRNARCCAEGKGQPVAFKQRGLVITVNDLVLELRGRYGCTKFVALAHPAVVTNGGCLTRINCAQFSFNTLSASLCLPSSGQQVTLRQSYQVNLTVDCIGKGILSVEEDPKCECECFFNLFIPNGIDVILCLREVVSILVGEQLVVLASPNGITPRVVDTFASVCDFEQCGDTATGTNTMTGTNTINNTNSNSCNTGCGCR